MFACKCLRNRQRCDQQRRFEHRLIREVSAAASHPLCAFGRYTGGIALSRLAAVGLSLYWVLTVFPDGALQLRLEQPNHCMLG